MPEEISQDRNETRVSLLLRVRDAADTQAWSEFHALYSPLLFDYAVRRGLQVADAEDVCSACLVAVSQQINEFHYDRSRGSFRGWLRTMVVRRVIDRSRRRPLANLDSAALSGLEDTAESPDEVWDRMWRQQHLRYCMDQVRPLVSESTWGVFESLMEQKENVDQICQRLGVSRNQVYKTRGRVLNLIRQKMEYLMPEEA